MQILAYRFDVPVEVVKVPEHGPEAVVLVLGGLSADGELEPSFRLSFSNVDLLVRWVPLDHPLR